MLTTFFFLFFGICRNRTYFPEKAELLSEISENEEAFKNSEASFSEKAEIVFCSDSPRFPRMSAAAA